MKTIAGGRHAGHFRADVLQHFDAVVAGEPERNLPALFADLERGALKPVYELPPADVRDIPTYRYDLMDYRINPYTVPVVEASRGCPFACNFCVLTGWERYRTRPIDDVLRDIDRMQWNRGLLGIADRTFSFSDNNLGGSPKYLRELCEALIPRKVYWGCALTYNILMDHDLVKLMGRAGCRYIYTGLESLSPESLKSMRKGQNTLKDVSAVMRRTFAAGIMLSFGLLVGTDGDTEDYLERLPDHLDQLDTYMVTFIGIVCPYPETPFFRTVASEGRLLPGVISHDLDGYTLCHRPRNLSPEAAIHHFKRLCNVVGSPARAVKNTWHQLFLSGLPRYRPLIVGGGREAVSVKHPLRNQARTYIAGQDPIEAWDAPQRVSPALHEGILTVPIEGRRAAVPDAELV